MKCEHEYSIEKNQNKAINEIVNKLIPNLKYNPDSQELLKLLNRGLLIIEKLKCNPDILILGLNPSYNKNHNFSEKYRFWIFKGSEYEKQYECFFKLLEQTIQKPIIIEYFDIFWVRESCAKNLCDGIENNQNLKNFIKEQFEISIQILKDLQPKIIIGSYQSLRYLSKMQFSEKESFLQHLKNELKKTTINEKYTSLPKPSNEECIIDYLEFIKTEINKKKKFNLFFFCRISDIVLKKFF